MWVVVKGEGKKEARYMSVCSERVEKTKKKIQKSKQITQVHLLHLGRESMKFLTTTGVNLWLVEASSPSLKGPPRAHLLGYISLSPSVILLSPI